MSETTIEITPELRQQLRRELVDALRSGEFRQGRLSLERDGENCCLGVACRVYMRHFPLLTRTTATRATVFENQVAALPDSVCRAFGFTNNCGSSRGRESLLKMNDSGWTFAAIADFIESNPPGLFVDEETP